MLKSRLQDLQGVFKNFKRRAELIHWDVMPNINNPNLIWNSKRKGTYIKSIHGTLK